MASASSTADRIARGHRDRSGETFERSTGGTATPVDASAVAREPRGTSERRARGAGHPLAEGHGREP